MIRVKVRVRIRFSGGFYWRQKGASEGHLGGRVP